jgi:hypothetical protein
MNIPEFNIQRGTDHPNRVEGDVVFGGWTVREELGMVGHGPRMNAGRVRDREHPDRGGYIHTGHHHLRPSSALWCDKDGTS